MKNQLLIFAGAGASCGVSADQYPTALEFRKRLPAEILENHLFRQIDTFLEVDRKENPPHDIEKILWELVALEKALDGFSANPSIGDFLFRHGQMKPINGMDHPQQVRAQFSQAKRFVNDLQKQIFKLVYDFYADEPTAESLLRTWVPLLRWARSEFSRVEIVTTNYDVIIEAALDVEPVVQTGRTGGIYPKLDLVRWSRGPEETGMLTKLHGSVDWAFALGENPNTKVRVGQPDLHGGHETRAILYPGFKGRPEREPFSTLHRYFAETWRQTTHALFIGFAFRDEHINTILSQPDADGRKVLVVDPNPIPSGNLPLMGTVEQLNGKFGEESSEGDTFQTKLASWLHGL